MSHPFLTSKSTDRGHSVERLFWQLLQQRDPYCRRATMAEQFVHVDFYSGVCGDIDVKARKTLHRKENKLQDELIWVEFCNVQGRLGWLHGAATTIAFERKKDFVLVQREDLLDFALEKCDLNDFTKRSWEAVYKAYTRPNRKDLLSLVRMDDVMRSMKHDTWSKQQDLTPTT